MTAPTPSPEEPRIVVRPQYVRLGAVLIALETSKSLREALRAVHDLKTEQFDDAFLTAPLREEVERLRESNRKLNERATKAEGAVKITVEDCRRQGVSLGRALANAGYAALEAEVARLRAENALLRAEATAHMENARAAVAENARLREALRPFAEAREQYERTPVEKRIFVGHYTKREDWIAAARALAEGQP